MPGLRSKVKIMIKRFLYAVVWALLAAGVVVMVGPQTSDGEPTAVTCIAFVVVPLIAFIAVWYQKGLEQKQETSDKQEKK